MQILTKNISKLAFLFIIFAVISGGAITHILSCQMQHFLRESFYFKHIIGIILIFLFIMLEGGWDFSKDENDKAPVDWASGNTVHTFIYALLIYSFFIASSKSKLVPNLILYSTLFIVYFVNSYRNYLKNRNRITEKTNNLVKNIELVMIYFAAVVLIYGLIDYYLYKKHNLGKRFKLFEFFFYNNPCHDDAGANNFN